MTKKQLKYERDIGTITSDFSTKELVQHAIIDQDYYSTVNIYFYDTVGNRIKVQQNIFDYCTEGEYTEIMKMNKGI